MNAGVEILLSRMESHPEEFFRDSRWLNIIRDFTKDFEENEVKALDEGLRKCRLQEFNGLVMQRIVNEQAEDIASLRYMKQVTATGWTTINGDSK